MARKKLTYESAYEELQEILANVQNDEVPLDTLATQLKRAKELIAFCKEKLRAVEEDLDEILEEDEEA